MNNQDLSTLLAELDAAWNAVGPLHLEATDEGVDLADAGLRCLAEVPDRLGVTPQERNGIVALVNAYPKLREFIRELQEEVATVRHFRVLADDDIMVLRERVRALEYEQQACSQTCTGLEIERDQLSEIIDTWGFCWMEERENDKLREFIRSSIQGWRQAVRERDEARRECDEARARAIRWNNEHVAAEDRWVTERDALRALVARQREALRDISEHLPCDLPCKMKPAQGKCGECGAYRFETWCAGCTARAALATEDDRGTPRVEEVGL